MSSIAYYALVPDLPTRAPGHLFYQDEKNELSVSPHLRLCGHSAMAHIESEEMARTFAEACAPIFQKRYGAAAKVDVVRWEASQTKHLVARIKRDSDIIRQRLEAGNFSPIRAP